MSEHIVVSDNRYITVPESLQKIGVQFDHNAETVTFDCPRYWDEHDLSKMKIYINYMRPNDSFGAYLCGDAKIDSVDDTIMHFDWTISGHVTEFAGPLSFLVCICDVDQNGDATTHWNSELNTQLYISSGMKCRDAILGRYPDIITQLLKRMNVVEDAADGVAVNAAKVEAAVVAASTSETNAKTSETNAASSASTASIKASEASASASAASKSADDAASAKATAIQKANEASTSAVSAAESERNAAGSATTASQKATAASDSEANASKYAALATEKATASATSEANAKASEDNAKASETNAANSATSASESETNAHTYATQASESAVTASDKATEATNAADNAATSEIDAENSAALSQSWAVGGTGTRTGEDTNNAKYWSDQAKSIVGGDFATTTEAKGYANAAETNAKTYADGLITTGDFSSKAEAQGYATTAETNAKTYADGLITNGNFSSKTEAQGYATTAEANAKTYADSLAAEDIDCGVW